MYLIPGPVLGITLPMSDKPARPSQMQTLRKLAGADMPFWVLPWLMVLLVAGTIAQREIGLYEAERIFFSSWVLWMGPIPLPGGFLTLSILTTLLSIKFLFFSRWSWQKAGINLTHLGVLLLLIGGMVTVMSSSEGYMPIPEGQKINRVFDYHTRKVSIFQDKKVIWSEDFRKVESGTIAKTPLPFTVAVRDKIINARAVAREKEKVAKVLPYQGIASQINFFANAPDKSDEANHNVLEIAVTGVSKDQDGLYFLSENVPEFPNFKVSGHVYEIRLERASIELPFSIGLEDVRRDNHPGMNMARGYESDIVIDDNDDQWPVSIRMNEPLRYRGKTFYQSSYIVDQTGAETTVLAVVENSGAIFPYLSSVIIALGLVIHLVMMGKRKQVWETE